MTMSPLNRYGIVGVILIALGLPACDSYQIVRRPAYAEGDYAPAPSQTTMPAVAVSRPDTARPVRVPPADAASARPVDPQAQVPVEVIPMKAEMPAVEPVRVAPAGAPAAPGGDGPSAATTVAKAPARPDSPVVEALRCYLNKSPEQAAQHLKTCDPTSRDLLACLLPLAVRLGEGDLSRADPQDLATLLEQVQGLLAPLRERAALEIPKLCFCRPVATPGKSGVYELLEENHLFRAGEVVALYMEVRNFTCAARGGDFRTHIATAVEIHDERGQMVYHFNIDKADPSLSPRHDFSNGVRFGLPALPAGSYTLTMRVTDVPTGRTARRSLDFRVTTVPVRQG
jgi:hypothetical protein